MCEGLLGTRNPRLGIQDAPITAFAEKGFQSTERLHML